MTDRTTNEATLRGFIDDFWNAQRLDAYAEFFTEDAVFHFGKTDYLNPVSMCDEFAAPLLVAFPDLYHEIDFLIMHGNLAAMRYHGTGTLQQDFGGISAAGQKLDYHGNGFFRMSEGRIAEVWAILDVGEWMAAQ